ncbi:phosphonate C-P lyase system protein PhnG [Microvirga sp. GCM10011540]|uniref:phosphonate C-P lyase system protein PhnG n=1 Tax=Microvirga sp. GCM10011540 TaxID=3317338 RepID=UPI0036099B42
MAPSQSASPPPELPRDPMVARRQTVMALCADGTLDDLEAVMDALAYEGAVEDLRRPETGLVMVRGRMGGDGNPFNFGEATVTRAAVRLQSGETGFAYQLGRDVKKARLAAILDALVQNPRYSREVERAMDPLRIRLAGERSTCERRTAATRVNFFTMVRGEDQ